MAVTCHFLSAAVSRTTCSVVRPEEPKQKQNYSDSVGLIYSQNALIRRLLDKFEKPETRLVCLCLSAQSLCLCCQFTPKNPSSNVWDAFVLVYHLVWTRTGTARVRSGHTKGTEHQQQRRQGYRKYDNKLKNKLCVRLEKRGCL